MCPRRAETSPKRHTERRASLWATPITSLLLVAVLVLAACGDDDSTEPTPDVTAAATPTATRDLAKVFPPGTTIAVVTRVIDGDTIAVEIDGVQYTVRYIGVDAPETVDPRRPVECFGREASDFNKGIVEGLFVGLEKDVSETDVFGRLLRYVWVNQQEMVNVVLVREGYAQASAYPPDIRYQDLFEPLEEAAREARRGLWGAVCAETASPTAGGATSVGACDFSGTSEPVIKGNISSDSIKIYHVPGGNSYEATVIDEEQGERWFCTEAEAVAAGWRKSQG
ncbi:MAG: thermonuclease family protein [Dehalococcoidia bacterium]